MPEKTWMDRYNLEKNNSYYIQSEPTSMLSHMKKPRWQVYTECPGGSGVLFLVLAEKCIFNCVSATISLTY